MSYNFSDFTGREQAMLLDRINTAVKQAAQDRRTNAGYSGSHGDGGAAILLSKYAIWVDGWNKRFPDDLKGFVDDAIKEYQLEQLVDDTEYNDYLRMKEKFKHLD